MLTGDWASTILTVAVDVQNSVVTVTSSSVDSDISRKLSDPLIVIPEGVLKLYSTPCVNTVKIKVSPSQKVKL